MEMMLGPDGYFSKMRKAEEPKMTDVAVKNVNMDKLEKMDKRVCGE